MVQKESVVDAKKTDEICQQLDMQDAFQIGGKEHSKAASQCGDSRIFGKGAESSDQNDTGNMQREPTMKFLEASHNNPNIVLENLRDSSQIGSKNSSSCGQSDATSSFMDNDKSFSVSTPPKRQHLYVEHSSVTGSP